MAGEPQAQGGAARGLGLRAGALYLNVFIVAICGLIYELLAGTLGSYLLGDSVTQFSLVIGLYLSAMGVGAWLSRRLDTRLAHRFLDIELAVAVVGGVSAPVLFLVYGSVAHFQLVLLGFVVAIGALVGLELPLLMRLLEGQVAFKDLVSRVLTFDYIGALAAALLFPLVLVPKLGLVRSSLIMGVANAGVGLWGTWLLHEQLGAGRRGLRIRALLVIVGLAVAFGFADRFTTWAEDEMYADPVVYSETTPYQRIVVTRGRAGFQLFLNGNLQFASADEYRYHEALVHPAMAAAEAPPRRVLILGGGDGLALREVLAHASVEAVTLVDLDPAMTRLARRFPPLGVLNRQAFSDPRVTVVNDDAMVWIDEQREASPVRVESIPAGSVGGSPHRAESAPRAIDAHPGLWDAIIVDFPDPNTFALGKLYTKLFYRRLLARLSPGGAVAVQSTSPLFARRSYWCIIETMRAAGFAVRPYHVTVPSFGVWGYALARRAAFEPPRHTPAVALRFLNDAALAAMFELPADMTAVPVDINQLDNQALVHYYEKEWRRWE